MKKAENMENTIKDSPRQGRFMADMRRQSMELMAAISGTRKEMVRTLKTDLTEFVSVLAAQAEKRKGDARDATARRMDERKKLEAEVGGIRQDAGRLVSELGENRRKMAETLKQGLSAFMAELAAGNSRRKAGARDAAERRQADTENRKSMVKECGGDTRRMLKEISGNQRLMAGELRRTLSEFVAGLGAREAARGSRRAAEVEEERTDVAPPAENAVEPGAETRDKETVKDRIVKLVGMHPDGIKMVQVAETLGVENWRALIPVMRELCDEELLGKEGPLYFV